MEEDNPKSAEAKKIVRNHAIAAVAASILPIPFVGIGVLGAVHLRMISQLAKNYEVEFSKQRANAIISSLVGIGATTTAINLLGLVPGIGQTLYILGGLTFPSASTYALGDIFTKHFESGGTIWTFDPDRAKADYQKKLAEKAGVENYAGIKP